MKTGLSADNVFVLNPNVLIASAVDYPEDLRTHLGGRADDFVISERRSRYSALRVSAETVRFIRRFETPAHLLDAVLAHSSETKEDPLALLDAVYPLVYQFQAQRILLRPEDVRPLLTEPRFAPHDMIGKCRVLHCVEAQTETEIYKVETSTGKPAALKWVPDDAPDFVQSGFEREQAILLALESSKMRAVPRVLDVGSLYGYGRFLVLTWCEGRNFYNLSRTGEIDLVARAAIGAKLAAIYVDLHRHGVLHGDVHPGNVLGDLDIAPTVLDFGTARWFDDDVYCPRAGLLTDYEPEAARDLLEGRSLPLPTPAGEQYCVAGVIFRLVTGTASLRLSLEGRTALKQIVDQEPKSFAEAGIVWPDLEIVLRRALAKKPEHRFATMEDFHSSLAAAVSAGPPMVTRKMSGPIRCGMRDKRNGLQGLLADYGLDCNLLDTIPTLGPTASLYYGTAGIAYAMLRAAVLMDDPEALAAADAWIERSVALMPTPSAFLEPRIGISPTDIGPAALFHTATGIQVIRALVRHVAGDYQSASESVHDFLAGLPAIDCTGDNGPWDPRFTLDIMNGAASHLLGVTLLHSICVDVEPSLRAALISLGNRLSAVVAARAFAFPDTGRWSGTRYIGMAHGLAGALFAVCHWADVQRVQIPETASDALDWLAGISVQEGNWIAWPVDVETPHLPPWTGWCHGSAGQILLWSIATRVRDREDDHERAIGAARHLWANRNHSNPSLCCGLAGEALSLCEAARVSSDLIWFDRAQTLLDQAISSPFGPVTPHSLFRGHLGVKLACLELENAEQSVFPLCNPPA